MTVVRDRRTATMMANQKPKPYVTATGADGGWRCGWCGRWVRRNESHDFDPHDQKGPGLVTHV